MEGAKMSCLLPRVMLAAGCVIVLSLPLAAQQKGQASSGGSRVQVCSLVAKAEVKKHLPWMDALDQMPVADEPVGATGSACEFPTVRVQVLAYTPNFIEAMKKSGPLEPISGVGDEAWFHNNKNRYAELTVKVGPRLLTLQANADDGIDLVKPKVISLAKVYVAKLR